MVRLVMIIISLIFAPTFAPTVMNFHFYNDSSDSASQSSAQLIVSTVRNIYVTEYMRNNGQEPTLDQIATAVDANLNNATVELEKDSFTVKSGDVTCIFEVNSSNMLILKDNKCGAITFEEETIEIGYVQ